MSYKAVSMDKVKSADGTSIAFERLGSGPTLVLVGGAFCDRTARVSGLPLARELQGKLSVVAYDRRGRGDSGATAPYAVAREVEDLAAVLAATDAKLVYGHSSGALLALETALAGVPMQRLALYEPPLVLPGKREPMPLDLPEQLVALTERGDRTAAAELFLMRGVGLPAAAVEQIRRQPAWVGFESQADTVSHDARLTQNPESILARAAALRVPTALFDGGKSRPWMREGVAQLAAAIAGVKRVTLPEQAHDVDPRALAPKLAEFLLA